MFCSKRIWGNGYCVKGYGCVSEVTKLVWALQIFKSPWITQTALLLHSPLHWLCVFVCVCQMIGTWANREESLRSFCGGSQVWSVNLHLSLWSLRLRRPSGKTQHTLSADTCTHIRTYPQQTNGLTQEKLAHAHMPCIHPSSTHVLILCHTVRPWGNAIQPVSARAGYLRCYYTPITSTLMCNQGEVMACALATHTLFLFLTALWTEAWGSGLQDPKVGKVRRFNLKDVCHIWKEENKCTVLQKD